MNITSETLRGAIRGAAQRSTPEERAVYALAYILALPETRAETAAVDLLWKVIDRQDVVEVINSDHQARVA
jgi:hypothetical protein